MLFPPIHDSIEVAAGALTCKVCGRELPGLLGCPDCLGAVVVPDSEVISE